ncbi:MAG: hypothetical protein K9K76_01200 [Halanaerobiales bacterium]|nr:hypothetical protein [Halanaerobiales bacterium]
MSNKWKLGYVIPNIKVNKTYKNDFLAIVPYENNNLQEIKKESAFAKLLLEGFRNQNNTHVKPSALIFKKDIPDELLSEESLVAFRNIVSLSIIPLCYAYRDIDAPLNSNMMPLYSDYFDLYPVTVGKENLITYTPSSFAINKSKKFIGTTSPHLNKLIGFWPTDKSLFESLKLAWNEMYNKKENIQNHRKLFRSLQIAFQALSIPIKNRSSINDFGMKIAQWVSAIEILLHSNHTHIGCKEVLNKLLEYNWGIEVLNNNIYEHNRNDYNKNLTLIQQIYLDMYNARNDFLHGEKINQKTRHLFSNTGMPRILSFAPIVYRTILIIFLEDNYKISDVINNIMSASYTNHLMKLHDKKQETST